MEIKGADMFKAGDAVIVETPYHGTRNGIVEGVQISRCGTFMNYLVAPEGLNHTTMVSWYKLQPR